jgi:predicted RNase H-like HicB family nuclease
MSAILIQDLGGSATVPAVDAVEHVQYYEHDGPNRLLQIRGWALPEDGGGFSARSPDLPGVYAEGDTADDAISSLRDALTATIAVYVEEQREIPWTKREEQGDRPNGGVERWILVRA